MQPNYVYSTQFTVPKIIFYLADEGYHLTVGGHLCSPDSSVILSFTGNWLFLFSLAKNVFELKIKNAEKGNFPLF